MMTRCLFIHSLEILFSASLSFIAFLKPFGRLLLSVVFLSVALFLCFICLPPLVLSFVGVGLGKKEVSLFSYFPGLA